MREHVHSGPYAFLFAGVSALIFFNLLRFLAVWVADKPRFEWISTMIGGLITFAPTQHVAA
jgi:hypothetical protein